MPWWADTPTHKRGLAASVKKKPGGRFLWLEEQFNTKDDALKSNDGKDDYTLG